ncbi:hypothetical protein GS399_05040 [Pedobacter sp. HMF7647]|uniref:Uncharacterized protein n=1 Tax=Hufsiella arboris TaxID=2695275 RepID=A0A7K1Y8B8_9SPHI|nr:hypothetical protein [Hufsiella arboris]MXV50329.1 hypothetical protein [Hufsiella arboris]
MTAKSINEEDDLPITVVLKRVEKGSKRVLQEVDALNLGRTTVKRNGVYRTFNDGTFVKIADGEFKKKRISQKQVRLF